MIQEQAAAAVIIALISEGNKSRKKIKRKKSVWNLGLKKEKNLEFDETLLVQLRLKDKYNYNHILRMTSENVEGIFQLIKEDIAREH